MWTRLESFFAASTDWKLHPEKYYAQPRIPKYKPKNGQFRVAFKKKPNYIFKWGDIVTSNNGCPS